MDDAVIVGMRERVRQREEHIKKCRGTACRAPIRPVCRVRPAEGHALRGDARREGVAVHIFHGDELDGAW